MYQSMHGATELLLDRSEITTSHRKRCAEARGGLRTLHSLERTEGGDMAVKDADNMAWLPGSLARQITGSHARVQ